jgi:hypothetical protein
VLVNVPKLKVHAITLFTNAIKNLGIGLYPMQSAKEGGFKWDYGVPHAAIPGMKGGIPHQVWVSDLDMETGIPKRDRGGEYTVRRTGGINATMIDIIKAVEKQGIFMIHIVDGIETINQDHTSNAFGIKEPEGMVFAGLDPVALDVLCARYMFCNVPLKEALETGLNDGAKAQFPQRVPLPTPDGNYIATRIGYDYPLSRDKSFGEAERRGLGSTNYYVMGRDTVTDRALGSFRGRLGTVADGAFSDVVTRTLYFDVYKIPWDLQQTAFHYFSAVDKLSGSSLKSEFLDAFDEDGDGIVTYEDFGKKGYIDFFLHSGGRAVSEMGTSPLGYLRGNFIRSTRVLKAGHPLWNSEGHHIFKEVFYGAACFTAYRMSQMGIESQDPFVPTLVWGKGKWPSFQLAWHVYLGINLYGPQFPFKMGFPSLYGLAFRYADLTQNDGQHAGKMRNRPDPEALTKYVSGIKEGQIVPLNFAFYLPAGYENVGGVKVPNVEGTADPNRVFTAVFSEEKEIWKGM